jgi:catechol O-methyltransferase
LKTQSRSPFFRLSFLRMLIGIPNLFKNWQVGDGREEKLVPYILQNAPKDNPSEILRVIDEYSYNQNLLINIGDEKGQILDGALKAKKPKHILELGTYCGYSSLRMAIAAPESKIVSIEFSEANAKVARSIHEYAGVNEQIEIIVGTIGDGGKTISELKNNIISRDGLFDLVFIDHDKKCYLPDLKTLMNENILAEDAVAVADNIKFPGAPDYFAYMQENEGKSWRTTRHDTHLEYQKFFKDIVLVSQRIN